MTTLSAQGFHRDFQIEAGEKIVAIAPKTQRAKGCLDVLAKTIRQQGFFVRCNSRREDDFGVLGQGLVVELSYLEATKNVRASDVAAIVADVLIDCGYKVAHD
jgi:hypothetical protein